ncbi:MAG TPA: GNAT family N-acetyltransferase [Hypericibacter adhaerens]|jgi:putative acetyltransferase|uniref:Acetyltransferase n=1 Tax=Hypericibacter adhaerens TaxID=2602016 RepID=A0A5J6MRZ7_9PROT|nr:GNAT family N-acetyltransferase [Hypericibacter adhaerens]QEX20103.1 acetyltransferase [Hypericibacter adhaerens]HWA44515.1 GNAT family N-acetyltransferase [Hypericibacter adhaerens]
MRRTPDEPFPVATPFSGSGTIRPVRPDDIDALIELFRAAVRRVAGRDYTPAQLLAWAPDQIDRDPWIARYERRPAWVAALGGRPVGFSDLEPDGHLDMMYVHPDHQGRGIATALLAQVEQAAHEQGIDNLYTHASLTARPFFERRGFMLIRQQTITVRGQGFTNFRMEKPLGLP